MAARAPRASVAFVAVAFACALASLATDARADDPANEAREAFRKGAELAKDAQWSAALASFERSARLRPHPGTTYNIGICERALGQYVRARRTFARALDQRASGEGELPEPTVTEIQKLRTEIDGLVGSLDVTLVPADARVAVDGQPLEASGPASGTGIPIVLAGTLPPGPGKTAPAATFRVVLDPGHHVFVISRDGFGDAVHAEDVRPRDAREVRLVLDRLPATIAIKASQPGAVVELDALDVGVAPVMLQRPAGRHRVVVRKPGFLTYETTTELAAGQRAELVATLREEKPTLLSRWWFWTAAAVVVSGAAVTTYAVTRPDPERPPLDGGGLGWTVRAP
jgi:hypothetical protein